MCWQSNIYGTSDSCQTAIYNQIRYMVFRHPLLRDLLQTDPLEWELRRAPIKPDKDSSAKITTWPYF